MWTEESCFSVQRDPLSQPGLLSVPGAVCTLTFWEVLFPGAVTCTDQVGRTCRRKPQACSQQLHISVMWEELLSLPQTVPDRASACKACAYMHTVFKKGFTKLIVTSCLEKLVWDMYKHLAFPLISWTSQLYCINIPQHIFL